MFMKPYRVVGFSEAFLIYSSLNLIEHITSVIHGDLRHLALCSVTDGINTDVACVIPRNILRSVRTTVVVAVATFRIDLTRTATRNVTKLVSYCWNDSSDREEFVLDKSLVPTLLSLVFSPKSVILRTSICYKTKVNYTMYPTSFRKKVSNNMV